MRQEVSKAAQAPGAVGGVRLPHELHRGVLTSGAADQLAALVARAADAPTGLIHFIEGDRVRLYGAWNFHFPWEQVADVPLRDTLAGTIASTGEPLIIADVSADPRVPPDSPIRARGLGGAYVGFPIRDEDGTVLGICCVADDRPRAWSDDQVAGVAEGAQMSTLLIAEQVTRQEVDRQRRFLDAVVDNLHDGIVACDPDGRIVLANARMRELWGGGLPGDLAETACAGLLFDTLGNPLRHEELALVRALRGEYLRDEELVLRGEGRRTRYFIVDAQPILGAGGGAVGALAALQDVTRRKRAERFRTCELAVTRALAEAPTVEAAGPRVLAAIGGTMDWAHAELWLVDEPAGVVRSVAQWNAPGWSREIDVPEDLPFGQGLAGRAWQVGKPLWIRDVEQPQSLISPEMAFASRLHTALAVPVRQRLEPLAVLTLFTETVEDPDDEVVALMSGIAAHIGQFLEQRMVEDLERQLDRSKDEYLALVGHELRTPLTSISAYTELLREADADTLVSDGPAMIEVVERNANQLRFIINELLELSALDAGHAAVQLAPMDLAEVVRESAERMRAAVEGEPITIIADLPDSMVLPGDRRRLTQIVDNLLGNAVKYSPDAGTVEVRLRPVSRAAELTVSDTGVGVSPEEREKMFTGLYRTSRPRDKALPGSGLGLTLSRAVVQRHHGTIELIDDAGPGTTIKVRLPLEAR